MLKIILKTALVLVWILLIGLLSREECFRGGGETESPPPAAGGRQALFGVYSEGVRAGYVRVLDEIHSICVEGELVIGSAWGEGPVRFSGSASFNPDGKMDGFLFNFSAAGSGFRAEGTRDGEDIIVAAGRGRGARFRISRGLSRADLLPQAVRLALGETKQLEFVNPVSGLPETVFLEGAGREYIDGEQTSVMELRQGNHNLKIWTDRSGAIVKARTPFGFTVIRENTDDDPGAPTAENPEN